MLPYFAAIIIGYLLGCSSMAFYIAKLKRVDIHRSGTGNLGASNAMVTMGWAAGVLTALHDIGKSVLAVQSRPIPASSPGDMPASAMASGIIRSMQSSQSLGSWIAHPSGRPVSRTP